MTPNTQSGPSSSNPAPVDHVKQLAATLLSQRGEASGAQLARELHDLLRALDADDRHSFQRHLATEFQPVISPPPRRKPRPRSHGRAIRPGRSCCGA